LTEDARKVFDKRYINDIEKAKIKPIHSYGMAARIKKSVENGIEVSEKKGLALKALQKTEALRLYRNNQIFHKFDNQEVCNYLKRIADLDFEYISRCRWSEEFLEYLLRSQDNLAKNSVYELYGRYVRHITDKLDDEVADVLKLQANDTDELKHHGERRFILHIGGTNSGKTYTAIERLKSAAKGVYAGPLRLLALEVYDKMLEAGVPCNMVTGQEQYYTDNSRCIAATVEMVEPYAMYDIAVIDEVQMINDPYRGHIWLNLILRLQADEIHLCMAPEVENVVCSILDNYNEKYEIIRHERTTQLIFEDRPYNINTDITRGDALILFSKKEVLDVAARLEQKGIKVSTIYGSLPPQIRKRQFEMFLSGETEVVVATDAIGLGVNLPIRRIVFMNISKFDGAHRRQLNEYEIRQIAGRAGRRGIYDYGYVTSTSRGNIDILKEQYGMNHQVSYVRIGFPGALLDIDGPLDIILEEWDRLQPESSTVRKIDIKEYVLKYRMLYPHRKRIEGFDDNRRLFELLSCDMDINNEQCAGLWLSYCLNYNADVSLEFPEFDNVYAVTLLEKAESYYKQLDLYSQFSRRMGKITEVERLETAKQDTEKLINEELNGNKKNYLRRCLRCNNILPVSYKGKYCGRCEQSGHGRHLHQYKAAAQDVKKPAGKAIEA
jgi:superfamily II DNA and RNA helicases